MKRRLVLVALCLLAGSSSAALGASPRAQARSYLNHCKTALAPIRFGPVTRKTEPAQKKLVTAAVSACGASARLKALAAANSSDKALTQAADAEFGIADGLANYGKYLADIAAGKTGHTKILNFSVEELREAKILLAEALVELK
jgi:hypothetical protein